MSEHPEVTDRPSRPLLVLAIAVGLLALGLFTMRSEPASPSAVGPLSAPGRGTSAEPVPEMDSGRAQRESRARRSTSGRGRSGDRDSVGARHRTSTERGGTGLRPVTLMGVRDVINEAIEDSEECFAAWQQLQPELHGDIELGFKITPDEDGDHATVTQVEILDAAFRNELAEGCLLAELEDIRWEPPDSEKIVTWHVTIPELTAR